MNARLLILVLAGLLGGCATRGALDFDCARFDTAIDGQRPFRTVLRSTKLESAIRGERIAPEAERAAALARQAEENLLRQGAGAAGIKALLLSGGGQWGAFGAGFMSRLLREGESLDHLRLVTGVSTGGLQALFIGAGLRNDVRFRRDWAERGVIPRDAHGVPRTDGGATYADLMEYEYRPIRENQIVNRNAQAMSIITGSMAGLRPLRRLIETALCANPEDSGQCMLDDLARSPGPTLIGFVNAEDGHFYYVNVTRIARNMEVHGASPPPLDVADRISPLLSRQEARQCIAAAALSSVAMPAFFQQVRVNQRTYYDGGVRRSVFADYALALTEGARGPAPEPKPDNASAAATASADTPGTRQASAAANGTGGANGAKPPPPTIYVLRNGPTSLRADEGSNDVGIVVDAALRAEAVVVNELEVGSVAGLRLEQPFSPIYFRSADVWESFLYNDQALGSRTCQQRKDAGVMFDPDFMRCIMAYGDLLGGEPLQSSEPDENCEQSGERPQFGWRELPCLHNPRPKETESVAGSGGPKPPVR